MDASALAISAEILRSSIRAIESRSSSLESWLYFWVSLVVIGVAIEIVLVMLEYREELEDFHRGTIHSPEKPKRLKFGFEFLAAALVVIGVSGELVIDVRAGRLQTELRTKNGELIRLLEGTAGAALNHALEIQKSSIQLAIDLETEKQRTLLLRNQLRTQGSRAALLTEVSSQKRFAGIERFKGQKIEIAQCARQDNEITMAVMTLMNLIRVRGWIVNPNNPLVMCSTGLRVIIRHNAPDSTRAAAKALGEVLNKLGLMPTETEPFTQIPEPKPSETPGWNPSSADTVLLVVLIHP
jgi:hypothetical protein